MYIVHVKIVCPMSWWGRSKGPYPGDVPQHDLTELDQRYWSKCGNNVLVLWHFPWRPWQSETNRRTQTEPRLFACMVNPLLPSYLPSWVHRSLWHHASCRDVPFLKTVSHISPSFSDFHCKGMICLRLKHNREDFLGQWNYSIRYYDGRYMPWYICPNP